MKLPEIQRRLDAVDAALAEFYRHPRKATEAELRKLAAERSELGRQWNAAQEMLARLDAPRPKAGRAHTTGTVLTTSGDAPRRITELCFGGLFTVSFLQRGGGFVERPTYALRPTQFKEFVRRLEALATSAARMADGLRKLAPANMPTERGGLIPSVRTWPGYAELERRHDKAWRAFWPKYGKAFEEMVIERDGAPFINLRLYPRAKKDQAIFLRFVRAALEYKNSSRLETRGAPPRTRALTTAEQATAEDMRRRGKGTEKGSVRYIAEEIRLKRAASHRREPALRQSIKRHLRRRGLTGRPRN